VKALRGIDPLPSGKFRLRLQVRGKPLRGTFATREEAAVVRDAALREIADQTMVPIAGSSMVNLGPAFLRKRSSCSCHKPQKSAWKREIPSPSKPRVAGSSPAGRAACFPGVWCNLTIGHLARRGAAVVSASVAATSPSCLPSPSVFFARYAAW
jgi:hypothetical protein